MLEHGRAVFLDMLVEANARRTAPEYRLQGRLAHFERIAPKVIAVELDQVEGIKEHGVVMLPVPDAIEGCNSIVTAHDGFAVDDAGV